MPVYNLSGYQPPIAVPTDQEGTWMATVGDGHDFVLETIGRVVHGSHEVVIS